MGLQMFDLDGKVAVVTGGARGIGRAIAEGFVQAGADVVIADIDLDEAKKTCADIKTLGGKAIAIQCDVRKSGDADALIRNTMDAFERVDILVNNAGISGAAKRIIDMPDEEWHNTLSINLSGVFFCSRAAAREMIRQKSGKIINVLSIASFQPVAGSGDYCASKGGGLLLTKVLALELIKHNINVNAICPGLFNTNLAPNLKEAILKNINDLIPIRRIAEVEEIQGLAVFLASPASNYLVGSAVPIDGGGSM